MKNIRFFFITFLLLQIGFSQTNSNQLIQQGIKYHDEGEYELAIQKYEQALNINKYNPTAHYEMALTYFEMKDYDKAIEHTDIVLKSDATDNHLSSYVIKGSSLDMLGKTKKSIKVFEKGIEETGGNYLLYFNLAIDYYKLSETEKAEENFINAINSNSFHGSSHYLLGIINENNGKKVPALLAYYYFLMLEPDSQRSQNAYKSLMRMLEGNVSKKDDNNININLFLGDDKDDVNSFSAAEMTLSLSVAANYTEEYEDLSDIEKFQKNTDTFFSVLSELRKDENSGVYWNYYVPFFKKLKDSEHFEFFCHFISYTKNDEEKEWFTNHQEEFNAFMEWLKSQKKE
ncbi:Tetratricopeptide repeat-containing protein [Pustulibacterium marinum]|uniref:Tetratricopeptide repeat-containing protein n=1 Tax=Pustulibacterium marinum TaxID=1224947 RepID=A0A1I7G610_9FLAO|nr:tetratricopeptide repeat protein [Pustulibacterium marinum]SFU43902.1 Tetratricopeptide repeat-containing protein [Pustulibacterium marinum]